MGPGGAGVFAEKLHLGSSNPVIGSVHFLIPYSLLIRVEDLLGNSAYELLDGLS